jgi:hypothetical protein
VVFSKAALALPLRFCSFDPPRKIVGEALKAHPSTLPRSPSAERAAAIVAQ